MVVVPSESDGNPDFLDDSEALDDFPLDDFPSEDLENLDFEEEDDSDQEFDLSDETFRQHTGEIVEPEDE